MSDLYAHTFTWGGHGETVLTTGSFDDWKGTLPLTRNAEGKFTAVLPIKHGEKISFKYIVDGQWQHNPDEPHETDASGNVNNVFTAPEAPVIVPVGETKEPVLPVPESIATTDAAKVSPAVISEPATAAPAVEEKKEESAGFLGAAAAGVGAAVVGAAGLVGAAVTSVAGSSPLTLVSSEDEKAKAVEPTPTPAVVTTTNTLASPSQPAAVEKAIVEEKKKEEASEKPASSIGAPVLGAAAAGVAAVGTGAAVVANKTGSTASATASNVQKSQTFQTAEGKAHDLAVQADKYKDQAVAEANKAYAEGEKLAAQAYEKVAATSFGASAMHALGLDKHAATSTSGVPTPVSAPAPVLPAAALAPVIPLSEASAPSPAPSAPLPAAPSAVTASPVVANQPTVPAAAVAPVQPIASSTPIAQQHSTSGPAAPATPLKEVETKVKNKFEGLGNGAAPSQPSQGAAAGSHAKKPSIFKRIFSSKAKKADA